MKKVYIVVAKHKIGNGMPIYYAKSTHDTMEEAIKNSNIEYFSHICTKIIEE